MNRRIWGVIIIILASLLIVGIIFLIFFYKFPPPELAVKQPVAPSSGTAVAPAEAPAGAKAAPVSPLKKVGVKEDDLARMAAAFAERFGSFSNQSDYGNIRDLQIFMTAAMKTWAQNYISEARARKAGTSIYYGIVTKSILSEARQFDSDAGQAEILVKTQRRESAGVSGNSTAFYQDIIIKYRLEDGVWRVDGVNWLAK